MAGEDLGQTWTHEALTRHTGLEDMELDEWEILKEKKAR